jgi:GNAT superfamily N-acetyltransferase
VNTVFLSDSTVAAYLRDLLHRLAQLGVDMPKVWCPIGPSGWFVAQAAMREAGDTAATIVHIPVDFDRATGKISFPKDERPGELICGQRVLLVDGAIHSGKTFLKAFRAVEFLGPSDICSYSLVVRAGSAALPSFFGVLIGDHDRALFLRKEYPNNRLPSFGFVRKLSEDDTAKPMITCGEDFIDKFSWSDFLYEMRVDSRRRTYLYERHGAIQGLVSFRLISEEEILLDTLAVGKAFQGQGIAGHLMRWMETCCRNAHCAAINLWGVESQRDFYEHMGYRICGKEMILDGVRFFLMGKKVLYNLPDEDVL